MSPDELVASLAQTPPEEVPERLTQHITVLMEQNAAIQSALEEAQAGNSDSLTWARVTTRWLQGLALTGVAFLQPRVAEPSLSRFGAAFLAQDALVHVQGGFDSGEIAAAQPTPEEWRRLDAALYLAVESQPEQPGALWRLSELTRLSLSLAQDNSELIQEAERQDLGVTGTMLAGALIRGVAPTWVGWRIPLLEEALELCALAEAALVLTPVDQARCRVNWAGALRSYSNTSAGTLVHLEQALELYTLADPALASTPLDQAGCRANWANALQAYFATPAGTVRNLEQALQLYFLAEPALAPGALSQARCRMNWASALQDYFATVAGTVAHLEQALRLYALAEPALAPTPADQVWCRFYWANALQTYFDTPAGTVAHLEQALRSYALAEPDLAPTPADQARCRFHWANALQSYFDTSVGTLAHLELAMHWYALAEPTLASRPADQARCRANWANALQAYFQTQGGQWLT